MDDWKRIYSTQFEHKAGIVKAVLKDNGINSVIVNKKDSVYLFGELEVYVSQDDVLKAKNIITKEDLS